MVKEANRPGPPESSVLLRVAAAGSVVSGIAACLAERELSPLDAAASAALVIAGMTFSHRSRAHPFGIVKPLLALGMVGAFAWFFHDLYTSASTGQVGAVEAPLAVLFVWIQVAHSFDVPARRDLIFSLGGSAALVAVAAAEALTLGFGVIVVVWAAFALTGLGASWASMAHAPRPPVRSLAAASAISLLLGGAALALLPPPRPSSSLVLPSSLAGDLPIANPGGLAGGGANGVEPAHAGRARGATRMGGFLGISGPLDTALRPALGNEVVMRVRAERPTYWIGEVYDHWSGRSWSDPHPGLQKLRSGSPFRIPMPAGDAGGLGSPDLQTFYLASTGPNLIFHASDALEVWFPERSLYVTRNGSIRTGVGMAAGSVYTVLSSVNQATPAELRTLGPSSRLLPPGSALPESSTLADLQLPRHYRRAGALARQVTATARTRYGQVEDLIGWIAAHTRYSLDIPPLAPGQDAVNQFLFVTKRGFCEQIATSLAVMLRTLGVPARVAAGYVPGSYNPLTDLWQVEAKDAHAWVQVWFPGYGWQSFDPTASVPLANPSPGSVLLHDAFGQLHKVPLLPLGAGAATLASAAAVAEWRRRRPRTWAERAARRIERLGRRAGRKRAPAETLSEYADAVAPVLPRGADDLRVLARRAEESAYGPTR